MAAADPSRRATSGLEQEPRSGAPTADLNKYDVLMLSKGFALVKTHRTSSEGLGEAALRDHAAAARLATGSGLAGRDGEDKATAPAAISVRLFTVCPPSRWIARCDRTAMGLGSGKARWVRPAKARQSACFDVLVAGVTFGAVEFGILGPLAVWTGRPRARARAGEAACPARGAAPARGRDDARPSRLVDALWGEQPPATAIKAPRSTSRSCGRRSATASSRRARSATSCGRHGRARPAPVRARCSPTAGGCSTRARRGRPASPAARRSRSGAASRSPTSATTRSRRNGSARLEELRLIALEAAARSGPRARPPRRRRARARGARARPPAAREPAPRRQTRGASRTARRVDRDRDSGRRSGRNAARSRRRRASATSAGRGRKNASTGLRSPASSSGAREVGDQQVLRPCGRLSSSSASEPTGESRPIACSARPACQAASWQRGTATPRPREHPQRAQVERPRRATSQSTERHRRLSVARLPQSARTSSTSRDRPTTATAST